MYRITTTSRQRQQLWQRLFHATELPVLQDRPRVQELPGRSVLAYDLALQHLHAGDRARLAAHVARRFDWTYDEARRLVESSVSWPLIDNGDLSVMVEERPSPAFVFGNLLHRISSMVGRYAH